VVNSDKMANSGTQYKYIWIRLASVKK